MRRICKYVNTWEKKTKDENCLEDTLIRRREERRLEFLTSANLVTLVIGLVSIRDHLTRKESAETRRLSRLATFISRLTTMPPREAGHGQR